MWGSFLNKLNSFVPPKHSTKILLNNHWDLKLIDVIGLYKTYIFYTMLHIKTSSLIFFPPCILNLWLLMEWNIRSLRLFHYNMKEDVVLHCRIKIQICITSHSPQFRFFSQNIASANARGRESIFNTERYKLSIDLLKSNLISKCKLFTSVALFLSH